MFNRVEQAFILLCIESVCGTISLVTSRPARGAAPARPRALHLEPVSVQDAEQAAVTWTPGSGLSLADRLCLALGQRLDAVVWTADRSWGSSQTIRQIR